MNNDSYLIYNSYSNDELFNIVLKGKENMIAEQFDTAVEILKERSQLGNLNLILENILDHYEDEELIKIVEDTSNQFGQNTQEVAEIILEDRGFVIEEENQESTKDSSLDHDIEFIRKNTDNPNFGKVYAKTNIEVYFDIKLKHLAKTIQKGTLIDYEREMIRGGLDLVKIVDEEKNVFYIKNDYKKLEFCQKYRVKNYHTDVLGSAPYNSDNKIRGLKNKLN